MSTTDHAVFPSVLSWSWNFTGRARCPVILGMILRVKWPNQQCDGTEGHWLVNQVKGQFHQAQFTKG